MAELVLDIAPNPRKPRKPWYFTAETARVMQERSRAAIRAKKALAQTKAPQDQDPATQPAQESIAPPDPELEIVQEQITRIRADLQANMEPDERAQLTRALDLMLDRKRILTDKPLPGSRRPPTEPTKQSRAALLLRREPGDREKGPRIEQR